MDAMGMIFFCPPLKRPKKKLFFALKPGKNELEKWPNLM